VEVRIYNLFNEAEERSDDDSSFEGLTEDYEKNGDGKQVMGHGERRTESRPCLEDGT
jgi:hypothetical protein